MRRVAIIGSPEKPSAAETMERTQNWLRGRAEVVFAELTYESQRALAEGPELLFVLGGDGTIIAAVHALRENQLPIVGVNLGKLGFLAEFTIEQLEEEGSFLFNGRLPVTHRLMLDVTLSRVTGAKFHTAAVNDCVALAGPPFRMIEMLVDVDGDEVTRVRGDGLIVATASGSTAHNLSAGGPILSPMAESYVLTPICPHALTYRSLVMDARRRIVLRVTHANEGTTLSIDGRIIRPFHVNDRLEIRRYAADFLTVRNPMYPPWSALRRKLMWGEGPSME